MIFEEDVHKATPDLGHAHMTLADISRRGEEVIALDRLSNPEDSAAILGVKIASNLHSGSLKNHADASMLETETAIEIVERALDRTRILLRARQDIYSDSDINRGLEDIATHQKLAKHFLTRINDFSEEQMAHLATANPDGQKRLSRVLERAELARHDFEKVTDYIGNAMSAGTSLSQEQQEEYFSYARPLPLNPREAFLDSCLDLAKLFTAAAENTNRRLESLLDLIDLNGSALIELNMVSRQEGLQAKERYINEFRAGQSESRKMIDFSTGYFIHTLNLLDQRPVAKPD